MNKIVQITPKDMVAVALVPLTAGERVDYGAGSVTPLSDIPMGHKVALRDIRKGEHVIKYGFEIGEATEDIPRGGHVHSHNLRTLLCGAHDYAWHPTYPSRASRRMSGVVRTNGAIRCADCWMSAMVIIRHSDGCWRSSADYTQQVEHICLAKAFHG